MDTDDYQLEIEVEPAISKDRDSFWFNDPAILFNKNRLYEFFPSESMSMNEKLNAVVRLGVYVAFVMALYRKALSPILIPIFIALVTLYVYRYNDVQTEAEKKEGFDIPECTLPTQDNPFSNTLLTDIGNYTHRKPACSIEDPAIKEDIEKKFNKGLFKDVNDLYGKNNSQRMFFTMPNTTELGIANGDTVKYANWLYNTGNSTCKEDNGQCTNSFALFNNDLRNKPGLIVNAPRY